MTTATVVRVPLPDLVTGFFTSYLAAQLNASAHTVVSYRDTFRLFLRHAATSTGRKVVDLTADDLAPKVVLSFLDYLEQQRANSVRTRNARLAAIRSFFSYAVTQDPVVAALAHRVLAIPFKKTPGRTLGYLTADEVRAILAGPDRTMKTGRQDYLALALLYDTGSRVQELLDLRPSDFRLDKVSHVRITGKGRKQRIVPLMPTTAALVKEWLAETGRSPDDSAPLVRNYRREKMTRSGIAFIVNRYRLLATERAPQLQRTGISPHTFRQTKAMHLLQAGVSPVTIKDILGHAHLKTLEFYVQADLDMKRRALEVAPSVVQTGPPVPRHPPDLLQWLEQL